MNPFNQSNFIRPELKQAYNVMSRSNNPMQMLMNMAQTNPSLQPVVQALQSGANPEQIFYQMCSSRGIDPQTILSQLK